MHFPLHFSAASSCDKIVWYCFQQKDICMCLAVWLAESRVFTIMDSGMHISYRLARGQTHCHTQEF